MKIIIYFWKEINTDLKYKHLQEIDSKYLNKIIKYFMSVNYNVMVYKTDKNIILYIDKGKFTQS